ncbi:MAG: hypothetical protein M1820_005203 [Bogoriella megaspora]|nr:MAG: hypothetical protein M1820_005203 [Bogoriella megaspora]
MAVVTVTAVTIVAAFVFYTTYRISYRLFFHPLAGFPGPRLTAATKCYEGYFDLLHRSGGQFTQEIRRMHSIYGPVVRINPDEVSVNDPDFYEELYTSQQEVRDKHHSTAAILGTTSGTFGTTDHHLHRKRKAANSPFFSVRNVSSAEPLITTHVEKICQLFKADIGKVWQLRVLFLALKLDIFFDYAFSGNLGLLQDPELAQSWDETIQAIATCAPFVKMFPWILPYAMRLPTRLVHFFTPALARVLRLRERIYEQAASFAENRIRGNDPEKTTHPRPKGIFQVLLESDLPQSEKSVDRISQEGSEMFAAAGTTARIMTAAIFHLHETPYALEALSKELEQAIPDASQITAVKILKQLPYLNAVIKESLRIAAPVATRLPLIARKPIEYREWTIPSGTPISVNSRDLLHNKTIFPHPEEFVPERWLATGADAIPDRYFVPFGRGARMCQGKDFAVSELQITLATLIRRFCFEIVDTKRDRDVDAVRDCFLTETSPGSRGVKARVLKVNPT